MIATANNCTETAVPGPSGTQPCVDPDLLDALPDVGDGDEKLLLLEDMAKMKQTLRIAEDSRDPDAVAKKRGMDTHSVNNNYTGIKIAKVPEASEVKKTITKRDLLPPPLGKKADAERTYQARDPGPRLSSNDVRRSRCLRCGRRDSFPGPNAEN